MSWHHCLTDELAKELADSSANVDGINLINLPSATFLPSGTNFAPVDEITI
jgi:hypothetical protein